MHVKLPATGSIDEEDQSSDEEESLHQALNTTEALTRSHLNPKVRPAEAEEYASYVDQYRNLNLSNELQYEHSAGDMQLYEQAVRMTKGDVMLADLLQVSGTDEEIYDWHIKNGRQQRHGAD